MALGITPGLAMAQAPGAAQPYPVCAQAPSAAQVAEAKVAHKAATLAYARGDYDGAIRQWTAAYRADCTAHGILVNLASAYLKKGDKQAAFAAFLAYVQRTGANPAIAAQIQGMRMALPAGASAGGSAPAKPAAACDGAPSAESAERARALEKAASEAYYAGEYDKAVKLLRSAYEADCAAHALLLGIARAEEKKGDREAAIASYRMYLAKVGPDKAIEDRIAALSRAQPDARR